MMHKQDNLSKTGLQRILDISEALESKVRFEEPLVAIQRGLASVRSLMKLSFMPVLLLFLSSCGQNHHLTSGFSLSANVQLPITLNVGQNYNLSGSCSPEGSTVILSSPDMTPSTVSAVCQNGMYVASMPVQFSGSGPNGMNPVVDVSITNPDGNTLVGDNDTAPLGVMANDDVAGPVPFGSPSVNVPVVGNDQGSVDPSTISITNQPPASEGSCAPGPAPAHDVIFIPAPNFAGTATCEYQICATGGSPCDTANVDITMGPGSAPVANDDGPVAGTSFGALITADVDANDSDADGNLDSTNITIVVQPPASEGTCAPTGAPNYDVVFTPAPNFTGTSSCTYQICDLNSPTPQCATAVASFTPHPGSAPVANNDVGSAAPNTPVTVDVSSNDSDPDGNLDPSSVDLVGTQPNPSTQGSCDDSSPPNITFTPVPGFTGTASCDYQICDLNNPVPQCSIATFTATIHTPPTAVDDVASGTGFGNPVNADADSNDTPGSGALVPSSITFPAANQPNPSTEGSCSLGAGPAHNVIFMPVANFTGTATCEYQICDSNGLCDTANIDFTPDPGAFPVANNDAVNTNPGTAVTVDVSSNDSDADGNLDPTSVDLTGAQPNPSTEGTCDDSSPPNITFTPVPGFTGSASCDYQICDLNSPAPQCSTATLTTTINTPPVANDDSASDPGFGNPVVITEATILANDTVGSGTLVPSTIAITPVPANQPNPTTEGTCAVSSTNPFDITFTPVPNFVDPVSCEYQVCDSNGLCDTADITFDPADGAAPVANNDTGSAAPNTPVTVDVSSNDSDPDGNLDPSSVDLVGTQPNPSTQGSCNDSSPPNITFTPVPGFTGSASCDYQICDLNSLTPQCSTATFTATIHTPPTAVDDVASGTGFGNPVNADADSNDTPGSGALVPSSITFPIAGQPNSGTEGSCSLGPAPAHDVIFMPVANFTGTATCEYQICDVNGLCDTANIDFTPDPGAFPVANDDTANTNPGTSITVDVVGGSGGAIADTDADGNLNQNSLDLVMSNQPNPLTEGACVITNAPLSDITFTPVPGFTGTVVCEYEICDSNMPTEQCDQALLTINVNAPPVANDDSASDPDFGDPVVITEANILANDVAGSGTLVPSTIAVTTVPANQPNPTTEGTCVANTISPYDITFTPVPGFVDAVTCEYQVCDSNGLCDTADITFDPADGSPPVAVDDTATTTEGIAVTVDVSTNDSDIDGNLDTSSVKPDPAGTPPNSSTEGVCDFSNPPNVGFTPASGFTGTVNCEYEICDTNLATSQCDVGVVVITVNPACGAQKYVYKNGSNNVSNYAQAASDLYYPFASYPLVTGDKKISGGTIDSTVTHINVKAWGAGGANGGGAGGAGGYSEILMPVSSSDSFVVLIGRGGAAESPCEIGTPYFPYGFNSWIDTMGYTDPFTGDISCSSSGGGGGLTGLFSGTATVQDTDASRAIVIAGGGGGGPAGYDGISGNSYVDSGIHGNLPGYQLSTGFQAESVINTSASSGGGGGYLGGRNFLLTDPSESPDPSTHGYNLRYRGGGGSGFISPLAVNGQILYTSLQGQLVNAIYGNSVPPMDNDADKVANDYYGSPLRFGYGSNSFFGQNGLMVITELCAGNDNDPFAAIDRTSTSPNTNVTVDVSANDADVDGDLDPSSASPTVQPPTAEGQCVLGANPGEIEFQPATGFVGTSSCEYQICDSSGTRCDTAILEVQVGSLCSNSTIAWTENTPTAFADLMRNDFAWGDYDGDGDVDLAHSGSNTVGEIHLYENNGLGGFSDVTPGVFLSTFEGALKWGDYDGDGDVDLISSDFTTLNLYRNDGGGSFTDVTPAVFPTNLHHGDIVWADFDGDSDNDLFMVGVESGSDAAYLFENTGGGTFVDITTASIVPVGEDSMITVGDIDNDGDLDILYGGEESATGVSTLKLLKNDGSANFTDATPASFVGNSVGDLALGDYDGDGDLDLFAQGMDDSGNFNMTNRLYSNDGSGNFSDVTPALFLSRPLYDGTIKWADYDMDGDLDLFMIGGEAFGSWGQAVYLYENDGSGNFTDITPASFSGVGASWENNGDLDLADVDGDGDLDLVFGGATGNWPNQAETRLYFNNCNP